MLCPSLPPLLIHPLFSCALVTYNFLNWSPSVEGTCTFPQKNFFKFNIFHKTLYFGNIFIFDMLTFFLSLPNSYAISFNLSAQCKKKKEKQLFVLYASCFHL